MQKALKIGYGIFLTAIIALALLLVAAMFPIPGNYKIKIVMSGSMEPAIKTGSIVVIAPAEHYAEGDIITFGEESKDRVPTTHRIVGIRAVSGEYRYATKGDANDDPDMAEVAPATVIGKVLFSIPYAGYIIDFARKPVGFVLLIVVPATAIILDELIKVFKEVKRMRTEKAKKKAPLETGIHE